MKRFVISVIFILMLQSCQEKEALCVGPKENVSGNVLNGISSISQDSLKGILALQSEFLETSICNPESLAGFDTSSPPVLLDSALLDHCQSCLHIYEWSGPGCKPAYEYHEREIPLINTLWSFDHLIFEDQQYYDACFRSFQTILHDYNLAVFTLGNRWDTPFEVNGSVILFEKEPRTTLRYVGGYEKELETIFENLFTETAVLFELTGNRLLLTHESGTQFIFYAE